MLKIKHPDSECNREQEELLAQLPLGKRRVMELMFLHGNIVYRYHAIGRNVQASEQDWQNWLCVLPENNQELMRKIGYEAGRNSLPFTRYIMEQNNIGLEEYIQLSMDPEDYLEYMALIKKV